MQCRQAYAGMLKRAFLLSEGPRLCDDDWVFQLDSAAVDNTLFTKDFYQDNNIALLEHPAYRTNLCRKGADAQPFEFQNYFQSYAFFIFPLALVSHLKFNL